MALATAAIGLAVGVARLAAIDSAALDAPVGRQATATGYVAAVPRRNDGEVLVRIQTPDGRLAVEAAEPVPDLAVGEAIRAVGRIRDPNPYEAAALARVGVRKVLAASELEPLSRSRGGAVALLDTARRRAEAALGRGTSDEAAALLRGFVLGQDDRIDEATVEEFRRSGLAHLLAVSGQNVLLLALLAWPLLALLGLGLRARLLAILALIALYVPIAGGGPSIQRAGVMGAAGIVAALAERPRSRWYAALFAAAATLALNPRASGDVGWQLSFAAVIGIMLWSRPLATALRGAAATSSPRAALAEGAAMTVAATIATAPLAAYHFERLSLAALPANLLALPAVAPVMWLGMLAGLAGQASALPVEPLTALGGVCAGFIAQVATWLGTPSWAQRELALDGPFALAAAYLALVAALTVAVRSLARRSTLRPRRGLAVVAASAVLVGVALAIPAPRAEPAKSAVAGGLRVTFLDVGQGDAVLLEPPRGEPILVDAGPRDGGVDARLRELGIGRLGALAVTHPQEDHAGGASEVLAGLEVDRMLVARADRALRTTALAAATPTIRVARGATFRSGALRLEVLWPPVELLRAPAAAGDDPNRLSLVLLARWRDFELLLTGDAEAEAAAFDPGPIDALKVAHHGSEDAGLERLLATADPELAVISVGDENRYGHPAPATLAALADHGVAIARTDEDGDVTLEVGSDGWTAR